MVPYELLDDPVLENCLSLHGQQNFLQKLVQVGLESDGLCWLGPPCSWWVWVSRSVHQRSAERPWGNVAHPFVDLHNVLAQFVADVIWTCAALGVHFVLEQPLGSRLPDYGQVREALVATQATRISIPLWKFGASSEKPLQLWGTAPWLRQLADVASRISAASLSGSQPAACPSSAQPAASPVAVPAPTTTLCTLGEAGQVTGRKEAMTASSSYPACFCDVVAFLHNSHVARRIAVAVAHILACNHPQLNNAWFIEALLPFLG